MQKEKEKQKCLGFVEIKSRMGLLNKIVCPYNYFVSLQQYKEQLKLGSLIKLQRV